MTPEPIHKSVADLKAEVLDIIEDNELSKADKHEALYETMHGYCAYLKGARETRKEAREEVGKGEKMTALAELNAKADALRKADPSLTREQAFTKVYTDPSPQMS
jgi:hypothetical protein